MPIKVTCQCGKSFAAKDELAGKAVKCPACQKPLRIPEPAAAASAQPPAPAAANKAAASAAASDLFDEIGLAPVAPGMRPCPGCGSPLKPEVVICIDCGYNTKLGRKMETIKMGDGDSLAGGHSATAADLLDKAARDLDEDREAEQKKTDEGMPWWVYLVGLVVLIGFLGTMTILANLAESKAKEEKEKEKKAWRQPAATLLAACKTGSPARLA
jgi:hypothetical protein